MTAYVLDASVAAKWFLPETQEPLSNEALGILSRHRDGLIHLMAPDLFWPEIGNILWKAARSKRIPLAVAQNAIRILCEINIATSPCAKLLPEAFAIAATFDQTVYDSIYLSLAVTSNAPFLTADERFVNRLGSRFPIRWLGSIPA